MFLFSLLLLYPFGSEVDQIIDRYNAKHKSEPQYEATYRATFNGSPAKDIAVSIDGTKRLRLFVPASKPVYRYVCSPSQVRELDGTSELYSDYGYFGRARMPKEPLSSDASLFPSWSYADDLKKLAPPGAQWTITGTKTINGKRADVLHVKIDSPEVKGVIDIAVDSDARIASYAADIESMAGPYKATWVLNSFKPVSSFPNGQFHLDIPLGFTPFSINMDFPAVQVGSPWPLTGWKSRAGFDLTKELAKGSTLFAILDENLPSRSAASSLQSLKATLPVVTIAADKNQPGTDLVDPTGRAFAKVDPPAFPFFALVDKEGKVKQLWMGFDPDKSAAFIQEVKAALTAE